jgi:hypothetical protein
VVFKLFIAAVFGLLSVYGVYEGVKKKTGSRADSFGFAAVMAAMATLVFLDAFDIRP